MKNIIYLLVFLVLVGSVSAITFKNAILLTEVDNWNHFGIRLNNSFEVTGDINVSLFNRSKTAPISGIENDIGYSSKTSVNLNDLVFYKKDGSQLGYQDAITNEWILSIRQPEIINNGDGTFTGCNPLVESGATACPEWDKNTLDEYDFFWITSYLAVNMTFPNVGGSNSSTSTNLTYTNLTFYNGTDFLGILDARTAGWWGNPIASTTQDFVTYFNEPDDIEKFVCFKVGLGSPNLNCKKTELNTWGGYRIYTNKSNIHLLFENTTVQRPYRFGIRAYSNSYQPTTKRFGFDVRFSRYISGVKRYGFRGFVNEEDFS